MITISEYNNFIFPDLLIDNSISSRRILTSHCTNLRNRSRYTIRFFDSSVVFPPTRTRLMEIFTTSEHLLKQENSFNLNLTTNELINISSINFSYLNNATNHLWSSTAPYREKEICLAYLYMLSGINMINILKYFNQNIQIVNNRSYNLNNSFDLSNIIKIDYIYLDRNNTIPYINRLFDRYVLAISPDIVSRFIFHLTNLDINSAWEQLCYLARCCEFNNSSPVVRRIRRNRNNVFTRLHNHYSNNNIDSKKFEYILNKKQISEMVLNYDGDTKILETIYGLLNIHE